MNSELEKIVDQDVKKWKKLYKLLQSEELAKEFRETSKTSPTSHKRQKSKVVAKN